MPAQPTHFDSLTRSSSSRGRSDTALPHNMLRDDSQEAQRGRTPDRQSLDILRGNEVSRDRDQTVAPHDVLRNRLQETQGKSQDTPAIPPTPRLGSQEQFDSFSSTHHEDPLQSVGMSPADWLAQLDSPQEPTTPPMPRTRFSSPTPEGKALPLAGPSTTPPEKRGTMPSDKIGKLRQAPEPPIINTNEIDKDVVSFARRVGMLEHAKIIENHASQLQAARQQRLAEKTRQWRLSQEQSLNELHKQ